MRQPRFRFSIGRFMILTAVLAAALAYLVAADREGRPRHCGTPLAWATDNWLIVSAGFGLIRLVIFGIRHPS